MLLPSAYRILYPINVVRMNKELLNLAFFDVLPSEDIMRTMFTMTESPATNKRFENIGFDYNNFLLNVGSSVIFIHL